MEAIITVAAFLLPPNAILHHQTERVDWSGVLARLYADKLITNARQPPNYQGLNKINHAAFVASRKYFVTKKITKTIRLFCVPPITAEPRDGSKAGSNSRQ
jgi:hypothetical protein